MAGQYPINDKYWMQQMLRFAKIQSGYIDDTADFVPVSVDKFGRNRVSMPYTVFDSKQLDDKRAFFWVEKAAGAGTASDYDANDSSTVLSVTAATTGNIIRQTRLRHNYQPGKSQRVLLTGVMGSGDMQVVLRSYVTGSAVDAVVPRSSWNLDRLDGSGPLGVTIDFTKSVIFVIEFEWLGVGDAWLGVVAGGLLYYCHVFQSSNLLTGVYMTTPNLPVRYEIDSDGATVTKSAGLFDEKNGLFFRAVNATADADQLKHICTTVQSEGGQELTGITRYVSTNGVHVDADAADTTYLVIALRLKSTHIDNVIKPFKVSAFSETNDNFEWILIYNPTIAGALTWDDVDNSAAQYTTGATANTVTEGVRLDGAWSASSAGAGSDLANILSIGSDVDGTSDVIALCARPLSSQADIQGSITWIELA